jgi:nicotinamidase-related amidase
MTQVTTQVTAKAGLNALLTPEDSIVVLIDHQPFQFANLHSHEPTMVVNNVVGLAKAAKAFNVPTILTTVLEQRGGYLIKGLQDVFPEQKPIDRTLINTWQDKNVVDVVKKSGRKKIVMAALWSEVCLAMPAIQAAGEGYDVYVVTDASGGVTRGAGVAACVLVISELLLVCLSPLPYSPKLLHLSASMANRLLVSRVTAVLGW